VFLAALLDRRSRLVVGWATSAVNDRHFEIRARLSALQLRRPRGDVLHPSDQGRPHASDGHPRLLRHNGLSGRMVCRGNCDDNAVMESFFSTVRFEIGERFESPAAARRSR